ncbi:MAG: glycosyltransferase, partial [Myxococcota bacterium]
MKIAYLLPAPGIPVQGPSGASAHARGIVRALRQAHAVRLWAAKIEDRRGCFGEVVGARAVGVPGWPSWLAPYREITEVLAARRLVRGVLDAAGAGWTPDRILERHTLFSDAGWRLHDRLGVPWALEVNAPPVQERQRFEVVRQPAWAQRWERAVLQAAPTIFAVSRWLVRWLREDVGCDNVHWVPNGVDVRAGDRVRGRLRLGVSEGEPVVGFVGSMKPWHGVDRLAAIAERSGARLALIGPRPPDPPADAIVTGHLLPGDLADVIAGLDVGLAPYPADAPP